MRLDQYLVEHGGVPSREKAKAYVMQGCCFVNNQRADKPGQAVKQDDHVELRLPQVNFVSRGGHKLLKGIQQFSLQLDGLCVMDIGASTGGFTDCALQHGAEYVYAVDVGYGQLAWSLRNDDRVCNLERTNIRNLEPQCVERQIQFYCIDVAFISLKLIFPLLSRFSAPDFSAIALIKPQFEAGREHVGKNGVVKDKAVQQSVIKAMLESAVQNGLYPSGLTFSPIKGPKGNIEFLLHLVSKPCDFETDIQSVVMQAHEQLNSD